MFKIRINIIFLFLITLNSSLLAQYKYEWSDYYDNNSMEQVSSVSKTFDGNLMLAGIADRKASKMWLIKINPKGKKLWSKEFANFIYILPKKIIETYDKNYVIASTVLENDSVPHKIWIVKINEEGKILWQRLYSGLGDANCTDIVRTYDKGFAISGYTAINANEKPDWYILKIDSLGYKIWDKSFGTLHDDRALAIDQMLDSSLIVVGYISYSYGGFKRATISHLSNSGLELNYSELKFAAWSSANDVVCTSDSAYVILAEIKQQGLIDFDIKIIKMTPSGDTIWSQNLNSTDMSHPVSIIETFDQGYAIAYTEKKDGIFNSNVGVLKLSPQGDIAWQKIFRRKSDDYAAQIIESIDNALIVAATNYSRDIGWNYAVLKYRSIEMSNLIFNIPKNNIATVYKPKLPIDAYITGYKKPLDLKIYINRKQYADITNFKLVMKENNKYLIKNKLSLEKGKNKIDFVVTDYKKYKFIKSLKIYYLPEANPHW